MTELSHEEQYRPLTVDEVESMPLDLRCCYHISAWNRALDPKSVDEWAQWFGVLWKSETHDGAEDLKDEARNLLSFAEAAIKQERERCARVAEAVPLESFCSVPSMAMLAKNRADVAAAIRARSEDREGS